MDASSAFVHACAFEKVMETIAHDGTLSAKHCGQLDCLLPPDMAAAALALVERRKVTCVTPKSGTTTRHFFLVTPSSRATEPYKCFDGFCTCLDFAFSVLQRGRKFACKHMVAVRLAQALRMYNTKVVDDVEFADAFASA